MARILCAQQLILFNDIHNTCVFPGSSLKATFQITQDPSVVHMTTVRCHQIKETAEPENCGTPNTLLLVKTEIGKDCSRYLHRLDKVKHQDFLPSDKKDGIHVEETHNLKRVVRAIRENIQGMRMRNNHEKSRRNRYRSKSKTNKRNAPPPKPGPSKGYGTASINEPKSNKGLHAASTKRQESASSSAGITHKPVSEMNKGKSTAPKPGDRYKVNKGEPKIARPRSRSMGHGTVPTNESKSSKGHANPQSFARKVDATAKKIAADTKQMASKSPRRRTGKLNKNVKSKGKFEKNLKSIEKDIAKQQKKGRKNSSQRSSNANLKGRSRSFGRKRAKKRKHPFDKNADNTAAKLAKKEKHIPSLPRHKSTKRLPSGAKQEEFEKRMNTVAKDFAKNDKDSPVAFDRLVNKVAKDLAKSSSKTNQKGDRVFIPRGKTVTLGKFTIIILFSLLYINLLQ